MRKLLFQKRGIKFLTSTCIYLFVYLTIPRTLAQIDLPTGGNGGNAGNAGGGGVTLECPLNLCEWGPIADRLIQVLVAIAAPVLTIMVIIAGFQLMTAAGNEERISTARKTLLYGVIGFAIILLSTGIRLILQDLFR